MTMTSWPVGTGLAETEPISAYQAIGGRAALTAAVDSFYGRLLADPVLGPLFPTALATGTGATWPRCWRRRWVAPNATWTRHCQGPPWSGHDGSSSCRPRQGLV